MTMVERGTRCIVGWRVGDERTEPVIQALVIEALGRAVKLFVYAWNRRQPYRQHYTNYPAHVMEFAYP